jgi:hypothetical protein
MQVKALSHEFVEFIPATLEPSVLYISIPYATAVHLCCSGCGEKVVTPLTPTDWSVSYDGETVSLTPSIGNWGFVCQSHYWIRNGKVVEAPRWSREQIAGGRQRDKFAKQRQFAVTDQEELDLDVLPKRGPLKRLWRRIRSRS